MPEFWEDSAIVTTSANCVDFKENTPTPPHPHTYTHTLLGTTLAALSESWLTFLHY
jgi:hypothetical protein